MITCLHIFGLPLDGLGLSDELRTDIEDNYVDFEYDRFQQFTNKLLSQAAKDLLENVTVHYLMEKGCVEEGILKKAEEINADLIIMGSKGASNLTEKVMGTITTHIIQQAPCKVLAIPQSASYKGFKKLAYATNFHALDQEVIAEVIAFAALFNADLHIIHVSTDDAIPDEDVQKMNELEAHFLDKRAYKKLTFSLIHDEDVVDGMNIYLNLQDINVLAILNIKRTLLQRLLHWSLTRKITFQSLKPLLVFSKSMASLPPKVSE